MSFQVSQEILVAGPDFRTCRQKALLFFEKNMLVRYDEVRIVEAESVDALDSSFWERVDQGEAANRGVLTELLSELKEDGLNTLDDIQDMDQGYRSKIFHTIAHLLDGFFGIDTCFYNLEDDSHWVSDSLRLKIKAAPAEYWLLKVAAESKVKTADRFHVIGSIQP